MVARTEPTLLWRNLIAICLRLARDRLSIDMAGLSSRLGILVSPPAGAKDRMRGDADNSRPRVERTGALSMGREVLLACDEDNRIIITEFRRFNEDGTRRLRFVNGYVELPRGIRWLVMRRTSTFTGMSREIENGGLIDKTDDVLVIETDLDDLDNKPAAQARSRLQSSSRRECRPTCLPCVRASDIRESFI